MAYSKKLDLLYIHVPKCGGTSIIESMKRIDSEVKHGHTKWNYYKDIINSVDFSFGIVRNPWDRALSCYNYSKMDKSFWHGSGSKYGLHSEYEIAKKMNFNDFILFLYKNKSVLDYPPTIRPNFRHNWDRQLDYLYSYEFGQMVSKVYRFENFNEISDMFIKKYNLKIEKLNSSGTPENYREKYNKTSRDIVNEIYLEDINFFGYKF